MNRKIIYPLLLLLFAAVTAIQPYESKAQEPISEKGFFEDRISNTLYNEANSLIKEGHCTKNKEQADILYETAIAKYDQIMKIHPNHRAILFNRGATYTALGEYEKAIEDVNAFLLTSPNDTLALENRGRAYELSGDIESAYKDYKAVELYLNETVKLTSNKGILERFDKDFLRINKKLEQLQDALDKQGKSIPDVKTPDVKSSNKNLANKRSMARSTTYAYAQDTGHAYLENGVWHRWNNGFLCSAYYYWIDDAENLYWYQVGSASNYTHEESVYYVWTNQGYTTGWTADHWLFDDEGNLNYFSLFPETRVCQGAAPPMYDNRIVY